MRTTRIFAVLLLFPGTQIQAAPPPQSLSGEYKLYFEQTAKDCGPKISPVEARVKLTFSDENVEMRFPSSFLGIKMLDAGYDPSSGKVSDRLQQRVSLGKVSADLVLQIDGKVGDDGKISYEVVFDKIADDPDWNCKVNGKGRLQKL